MRVRVLFVIAIAFLLSIVNTKVSRAQTSENKNIDLINKIKIL